MLPYPAILDMYPDTIYKMRKKDPQYVSQRTLYPTINCVVLTTNKEEPTGVNV